MSNTALTSQEILDALHNADLPSFVINELAVSAARVVEAAAIAKLARVKSEPVGYYLRSGHGDRFQFGRDNPCPELEWPPGSRMKAWEPVYTLPNLAALQEQRCAECQTPNNCDSDGKCLEKYIANRLSTIKVEAASERRKLQGYSPVITISKGTENNG